MTSTLGRRTKAAGWAIALAYLLTFVMGAAIWGVIIWAIITLVSKA